MKKKLSIIAPNILTLALAIGVVLPTHALESDRATTRLQEREQRMEERKAERLERATEHKEAHDAKLEQRRLDICKKREQRVNTILKQGVERGKRHLAVFEKISERVQAFYTEKNLSAEGYDAAVIMVNERKATATAAIEEASNTTFDCATTDALRPGQTIKKTMQIRHAALKEYRKAIKNLILTVKKAHGQQQTNSESTAPDQNKEEN